MGKLRANFLNVQRLNSNRQSRNGRFLFIYQYCPQQIMKKYTAVHDIPDINALVAEAQALKNNPFQYAHLGKNKTLVLLFLNPSLRTRLSTQLAAQYLGMNCIVMNMSEGWNLEFEDGVVMNLDRQEHIKEAAAVISQYADIIGLRTFPSLTDKKKDYEDFILHQLIRYTTVPVLSLESAIRHPLQSLADLLTIEEFKTKARPKVVLSWAPHPRALPQAVPNSFAEFMGSADVDFVIAHPEGYELESSFTKNAKILYNQDEAFANADFIYAKNWSSYHHYGQILNQDSNWMITNTKMTLTNQAKFMHCLPVRRNVVVSDEVLDGSASIVIAQANNRTFAAQAVLKRMLEAS
jgi:N-succinyl-L-ornithine transcarbamylase